MLTLLTHFLAQKGNEPNFLRDGDGTVPNFRRTASTRSSSSSLSRTLLRFGSGVPRRLKFVDDDDNGAKSLGFKKEINKSQRQNITSCRYTSIVRP